MKLLPILLLVPTLTFAGPFVEVGIGASINVQDNCIRDYTEKTKSYGCSDNPLGMVALGWEHNGFSIQAEHMSSLTEKDPGLNVISIKYRYNFFGD